MTDVRTYCVCIPCGCYCLYTLCLLLCTVCYCCLLRCVCFGVTMSSCVSLSTLPMVGSVQSLHSYLHYTTLIQSTVQHCCPTAVSRPIISIPMYKVYTHLFFRVLFYLLCRERLVFSGLIKHRLNFMFGQCCIHTSDVIFP